MDPRLVIVSGVSGAGKTTVCKEATKLIANAIFLDRDEISRGIMSIPQSNLPELLDFKEYVKNDTVFAGDSEEIETPFGRMIRIYPSNAFFARHGRDQSYIAQAELARTALLLGKIPILDGFVARQIKDGTLKRFINQSIWGDYPRFLVHFTVSKEEAFRRAEERTSTDREAAIRQRGRRDKEEFFKFLEEKHPPFPTGLEELDYLLIDTTNLSSQQCVEKFINYISA